MQTQKTMIFKNNFLTIMQVFGNGNIPTVKVTSVFWDWQTPAILNFQYYANPERSNPSPASNHIA
tara:strand:+ start:1067 stop:1261 length:195 start_codon:yes stop_codon:yes gene_type:complete